MVGGRELENSLEAELAGKHTSYSPSGRLWKGCAAWTHVARVFFTFKTFSA